MPDAPTLTADQVATATAVVPIDSVRPHPQNANRGSVAAIRESLREHGIFRSIVVQKSTGHILAGNTTWQACREEGLAEVPIIELDVDDRQAVKIMLADNRTAQLGDGYDDQALAELLQSLQGDFDGTGWEQDDLTELLEGMGAELDPGEEEAGDDTDRLGESYSIIVTCRDEAHQAQLLDKFDGEGLTVRALIA